MKENLIARSLFTLAICIVIGSWLISSSISRGNEKIADYISDSNWGISNQILDLQEELIAANSISSTQKQLLNSDELGEYLGIRDFQVKLLLPDSNNDSPMPYVKIGKEYYFPKSGIDKWLTDLDAFIISNDQ
ncbi:MULTISPECIES: hypothetical protein [Bacillaceae]|uniref:hypothetical protein n=1 Tax=Bacillaceae TaxID=186817 RepID=UPI001BDE4BDD|nr:MULTISPECIES: hypothetical protein [Bacillaceae]MDX8360375.1 hypothetical protein [Cytobacillus sp. IB215316]